MNIIVNNLIHIQSNTSERPLLLEFFQSNCVVRSIDSWGSKEAEINNLLWDSTTRDSVTVHSFYLETDNGFLVSRGNEQSLIKFLKDRGIQFTLSTDYSSLHKITVESRIKQLRHYQTQVEQVLLDQKNNSGYCIIPTGGGKTVVMINHLCKIGGKTLVVVHTTQLLNQFIERLIQFTDYKAEDVCKFGDTKKQWGDITIALMQSLGKLTDTELQEITREYDLVMIDECHHMTADTFKHIVTNIQSKYLYGFTATPDKSEGTAALFMQQLIGPCLFRVTEETLEQEGIILRPHLGVLPVNIPVNDFTRDRWSKDELNYPTQTSHVNDHVRNNQYQGLYLTKDIDRSKSHYVIIKADDIQQAEQLSKVITELPSIIVNKPVWNSKYLQVMGPNKAIILVSDPQSSMVDMNKIKRKLYYSSGRMNMINQCITHEMNNNKNGKAYILILSDEVGHLEYMYENIKPEFKSVATLLHGQLGKKEIKRIEQEIDDRKYQIILATSKLVGEGWDKPHLNVLIMSHMMKDHEGLKQLVGRIVRTSPEKHYCIVYDIVDVGNPVTWSQFMKRYNNYYQNKTNFKGTVNKWERTITYPGK